MVQGITVEVATSNGVIYIIDIGLPASLKLSRHGGYGSCGRKVRHIGCCIDEGQTGRCTENMMAPFHGDSHQRMKLSQQPWKLSASLQRSFLHAGSWQTGTVAEDEVTVNDVTSRSCGCRHQRWWDPHH